MAVPALGRRPGCGGGIEPVLGWSKMVRQSMNFGAFTVPHAALMIDAHVDGLAAPALMQLDTGAVSLVHRVPKDTGLQRTTWRGHEFGINGTAAGRQFHDEWFGVRKDDLPMVEGKPVIGTIGASFFERRILILDFVSSRVATLNTGREIPAEVERRAVFTPLEYRDERIFVTFQINGSAEGEMVFDSGSSAFAMATTRRRPLALTGRQPNDARNENWNVNSRGNTAHMIGAPMKGEICFARACLLGPMVFFESIGLQDLDFDHSPYKPPDGSATRPSTAA
jgi:hypothetical protein